MKTEPVSLGHSLRGRVVGVRVLSCEGVPGGHGAEREARLAKGFVTQFAGASAVGVVLRLDSSTNTSVPPTACNASQKPAYRSGPS